MQFVAKNMWKITSGSLELIFYQEKLTMLKFEAFFSQITLCVSAVQVHQNCVYERGRLTSGLYNNGCACAKVYSIIFFLVRFYFLEHIFSKCKLGISLIKISLSTLCSANIENLTPFIYIGFRKHSDYLSLLSLMKEENNRGYFEWPEKWLEVQRHRPLLIDWNN